MTSTAEIEGITLDTLPTERRYALAILSTIPVDDLNQLKSLMHLSRPGVIGPDTLNTFLTLCTTPPVSLDLSVAGVNAFKDANGLGNTGPSKGVIGPQTAQYYYEYILQRLSPDTRRINAAGFTLIKRFEGYAKIVPGTSNVTTYLDPAGIPTIGYGHTGPDVTAGLVITEARAEELLAQDLARFETGVLELVTVPLTDNEFSALVSFAFNLGLGTLEASTLLRLLNAGEVSQAADQFLRFVYADGQALPGLVARREAERALFLSPLSS